MNIKIALAGAKRAGRLSEKDRIKLLARMTDEVAALVLEDNRLQALALSIAEQGGAASVPPQLRLIEALEDRGSRRQTEGRPRASWSGAGRRFGGPARAGGAAVLGKGAAGCIERARCLRSSLSDLITISGS